MAGMRGPSILVIALSMLSLAPAAAAGGESATVVIGGDADFAAESLARLAAEDVLRGLGVEIFPPAGDTRENLAACADLGARCVREAAVDAAAETLVYVTVASTGSELVVRASLFSRRDGRRLASGDRDCGGCDSAATFAATVEEVTRELWTAGHPAPPPAEAPEAEAPLAPPAAAVDSSRAVSPAAPKPAAQPFEDAPRRPYRVWKYAALGTGVAALATGGVLLAIDGPRIENSVRLPEERSTQTAGFVTLGVGGALVATSALLWLADSADADADADDREGLSAGLGAGGGGASLWLQGRF